MPQTLGRTQAETETSVSEVTANGFGAQMAGCNARLVDESGQEPEGYKVDRPQYRPLCLAPAQGAFAFPEQGVVPR